MVVKEVFTRGLLPGLIAGRKRTRALTLIVPFVQLAVIVYFNRAGERPGEGLRAHEKQHVLDWGTWGGWYYARTYLWDLVTVGYRLNRWERRAYAVQAGHGPETLPAP